MPNTETPAGTAGGPVALPDLPEKLRVHALAKLLGRASREVLAALADLGVEVRSAQSSLDRVTAEKVAAALQPATGTADPAPAADAPAEPAAEVPTEAAAEAPAE
ncbi:MAG: translation initiation factor IF-2 N-terminal domain-containing protein, partial [Pseudonocardiales bacterium]|nr:translation initiation factor IF-2 N-terminal domain-containing protein [Pseudonocardiales bacterium]